MVEHTHRQAVDLVGVLLPAHDGRPKDLAGGVKGAVVEVDDAQVVAQGFGEVRVVLEVELEGAKGLVELGIGLDGRLVHLEPGIAKAGLGLDGLSWRRRRRRLGGLDRLGACIWLRLLRSGVELG